MNLAAEDITSFQEKKKKYVERVVTIIFRRLSETTLNERCFI
jgi:hypothetical protein